MFTLKTYLGILLGVLSLCGLAIDIIVVVPVFRLAFIQKKSPIYVISLINIIVDIVNMMMACFYLTPSILYEKYLLSDHKNGAIPKLFGTLFMLCWYLGSFTQMVMATNRLIVIYYRRSDLFTRRNILLVFLFIIPFCVFLAYMSQYGFPCCAFIFDHTVLSYSYYQIEGVMNYPNLFIDLPLNFTSSSICTICYAIIVWTVRKSAKSVEAAIKTNRRSRRNREVTYAIQFCFISMFYTFSWITFRIFPPLIGNRGLEWFVCISIAVTINSSANAIIYLISNQEVRNNLKGARFLSLSRAVAISDTPAIGDANSATRHTSHNTES